MAPKSCMLTYTQLTPVRNMPSPNAQPDSAAAAAPGVRDQAYAPSYPARILHSARDAFNGRMLGAAEVVRPAEFPEDMLKLRAIGDILGGRLKIR